jgi:hypothetical protein
MSPTMDLSATHGGNEQSDHDLSRGAASDVRAVARAYLNGWKCRNKAAIIDTLHVAVRFVGPMTRLEGRDAVAASFGPLFPILRDVSVRHLSEDGNQAVAVYDFLCVEPVGSIRMAELLEIEGGLVRSIEMFFDPRPFIAAQGAGED